MIVLHEDVEVGLALAGEAVGGTKELAIRPQHHPRSGLFPPSQGQTVSGKPLTQLDAADHVGTGGADIFADDSQIDPDPFRRLMLGAGEGGGWALPLPQMCDQLAGYLGLSLGTQGSEDGKVMRPGDDGMAEQDFDLAGNLFMPSMVEARRQNLSRRRIRLWHHNMPMSVCRPSHGAGLGVLHDEAVGRVEAEFLPQHIDHLVELVALHFHLGGNDEMPNGIAPTKPAGIIHGVVEVGKGSLHNLDRFIVLGIGKVPSQCTSPSGGSDTGGFDQHGQRPSSIWASARACARSSVRPWRASMELMRRRSEATAWASSEDKG
ncbi:hypothetical protein [Devosia sp.]|uniref:hypothetical protein n=1 Tax=Devosia sp. TaxID=1871048 RepID=UPI0025BA1498|nr:hypothetical protein [Devosia sp.]